MHPVSSISDDSNKSVLAQSQIAKITASRDHLNQAIQDYAIGVWNVPATEESDQIFFASFLYNADFAKFQNERDPKVQLALKVRTCIENYLNDLEESRPILFSNLSSLEMAKKVSSLFSLAKAIDESYDEASIFLWGTATVTGGASSHTPSVHASIDITIVSASMGLLKSLKNGILYLHYKIKANRVSKKIQINSASTDNTLAEVDRKRNLRTFKRKLEQYQHQMHSLKHHAHTDVALSSTFFSGSVVPAAATTTAAVISGAALGGIAYGGLLAATSASALAENREQMRTLDKEDLQLAKMEKNLPQESLQHEIVQLRRDNIASTQKLDLRVEHIKNGLLTAAGTASVAEGLLSILVGAGIAISATAIAATGIGLGILTLITVSVYIGHLIYRYKQKNTELNAQIELQQFVLSSVQQAHAEMRLKLPIVPSAENSSLIKYYLAVNRNMEREKGKLLQLTHQHEMEKQASKDYRPRVSTLCDKIDHQSEDDILILKLFFEKDLGINLTEFDLIDSIESKRSLMKLKIMQFVTRAP